MSSALAVETNDVQLLKPQSQPLGRALVCALVSILCSIFFASGLLVGHYAIPADQATVAPRHMSMAKKLRVNQSQHLPISLNTSSSASRRRLATADASLSGAAFADYSVDVRVGSQMLEAIVDTGSSYFVVANNDLNGLCSKYYQGSCNGSTVFGVYGTGSQFSAEICLEYQYSLGSTTCWLGSVCDDATIELGGYKAGDDFVFAGIKKQAGFLRSCESTDGMSEVNNQALVGMAYPALMTENPSLGTTTLFTSIAKSTGLADIFSMQCCGWTATTSKGTGTLTLGGHDSTLFVGKPQYTKVTDESYYCVKGVGQLVGIGNCSTIIDSGTSMLVVNDAAYTHYSSAISAAVTAGNLSTKCGSGISSMDVANLPYLPCLKLEFDGGVTLSIPPSKYYQPQPDAGDCHGLFIGNGGSGAQNIVGQVMMEAYYTIFDREASPNQVGFAPLTSECAGDVSCSGTM